MHDDLRTTVIEQHNTYTLLHQAIPAGRLEAAINNPDALQVAYNVGVLELLSISLTILGVVLAASAFAGFWMIRHAAMNAARNEAKEWIALEGPRLIDEYLRSAALNGRGEASGGSPAIHMSANEVNEVLDDAEEITEDDGKAGSGK